MYAPDLVQRVREILDTPRWSATIKTPQYRYTKKEVMEVTSFLPSNAKTRERLHVILNSLLARPLCPTCGINDCNWNSDKFEYRHHCSDPKCKQHDPQVKSTRKNTNLERYGTNNLLSVPELVEKRNNTIKERYGVDHQMRNLQIKDKMIQTNLDRYGNTKASSVINATNKAKKAKPKNRDFEYILLPYHSNVDQLNELLCEYEVEYPNKQIITQFDLQIKHHDLKMSHLEISQEMKVSYSLIHQWITKSNICTKYCSTSFVHKQILDWIETIYDGELVINDRRMGFEVDILIPSLSLAIEINGLYWHSESNGKHRQYHLNKTKLCKKNGIQLMHITDHQWYTKTEIVKSRITNKLSRIVEKVFARKTECRLLNVKDIRLFLNENHIQQFCNSNVGYGLYYNEVLVSVMTFGVPRYNKHARWELLRFASKLNTVVVGGATKLFKHFIKNHDPESVVTYSDSAWNTGAVYGSMGFSWSHSSDPGYTYFKDMCTYHRTSFQKHKLENKLKYFDSTMTEYENMLMNGYDRIWDCGNDVWMWSKNGTQLLP